MGVKQEVANGQTSAEMEITPDRPEGKMEGLISELKGTEKCP